MASSPNAFDMAFGQALRSCRLRLGLSQEELEFRSGVHRTYISEIERAIKCPSLRVVVALAKALGERPHALLQAAESLVDDAFWLVEPLEPDNGDGRKA